MARKMFPNKTDLDSPRIRFNWGFWDGLHEGRNQETRRTEHANLFYGFGYSYGYSIGTLPVDDPESSTQAWLSYQRTMTIDQVNSLYQEILECEIGGYEHCLRRRADDYILNHAKENASRAMIA